jgi:hypothetical protein
VAGPEGDQSPGLLGPLFGGAGMTIGPTLMVHERLGGMEGGFGWEHLYQI